jgi:hypothetical protein
VLDRRGEQKDYKRSLLQLRLFLLLDYSLCSSSLFTQSLSCQKSRLTISKSDSFELRQALYCLTQAPAQKASQTLLLSHCLNQARCHFSTKKITSNMVIRKKIFLASKSKLSRPPHSLSHIMGFIFLPISLHANCLPCCPH